MRQRPRIRVLGLLATFALVVAACGGQQPAETTEQTTTTAAASPTTAGDTTTTAPPATEPEPAEPIKIGLLTDLTKTFTPWAVNVRDGMLLAAQEINDAGGVDGRPIEIVIQDSENDADAAVRGFERLVEEGVVAVGGPISSTVGAATGPVAEELQVPLFLVKSGTPAALTADSRYTFRTCLAAAPMLGGPIAQYAQEQGFTRVGAIVADYAWGQAMKAALESAFADTGIDLTIEVAPVPPSTDFTPFVRNIAEADPQLLVASGHPPGMASILPLSAELLDVPVTGAFTPPDLIVGRLADVAIGRYADFPCADYFSAEYQDLARRYLAFSDNKFMSDDAVAGYGIVQMVAQAVEAVGDDPQAIAEYMHANSFDLPGFAYTLSWTDWGELAAAQPLFVLVSEGPAPEGVNEAGDWWFELLTQSEPLEPYMP